MRERLLSRGLNDVEDLSQRLARAEEELRLLPLFDYILYNDDIDKAMKRLTLLVQRKFL